MINGSPTNLDTLQAGYRYDVYGKPTATVVRDSATVALSVAWAQQIAADNVLRYASYCWDAHSRLYYLQSRYYDPVTRQFMSRDPIKADGDESPYQYCAGCPIIDTDPTGEQVLYNGDSSSNSGLTKKQRAKLNAMTAKLYSYSSSYYYYMQAGCLPAPSFWQAIARIVKSPTIISATIMKGGSNPLFLLPAFSGAVAQKYSDERFIKPYWNMHRGDETAWKWIVGLGTAAFGGAGGGVADEGVIAEEGGAFFRYVSEGEAKIAARTGRVPNVDLLGKPKPVFYSTDLYRSSGQAEDALQIGRYNPAGATASPTHGIAVSGRGANWTYGGTVEGGPGIQLTTDSALDVLYMWRLQQ